MRKFYSLLLTVVLFGALKVNAQVTQTFSYTGSNQTFVVPTGVTSISVKIWGAGGAGASTGGSGGSGALVKGTATVSAGQSLVIVVGGGGSWSTSATSTGGFGGGGSTGGPKGASGGGYSGIFLTSVSQANAIGVAGGGAGGGYYSTSATYGGAGGATTGSNGGDRTAGTFQGGRGATVAAAGAGGAGTNAGAAGAALAGGTGGTNATYGGGGGGGGYYGGGGGYGSATTTNYCSGGGGGSSFLGTMTSTTNTAGTTSTAGTATQAPGNAEAEYVTGVGNGGTSSGTSGGNGLVTITYTLPACTTPTSIAASATASATGVTTINGSFTAAPPTVPTGYIVVRTTVNTQPTPVTGTTYSVGSSGIGYIEYSGTSAGSWTSTGLTPNTPYYYWVFSYNNTSCTGPVYSTTATTATATTNACPSYSGTMTVGPTGTFTNLTNAITSLTACGYTGNIILELQSTYVSSAETFPITFSLTLGSTSSKTITIRPEAAATGLSIASANTTATIDLNGGQYIYFDGRPGGAGVVSQLTVSNTSTATGGTAVRFINDANNNGFSYVNLSALYASATSGVITFSTTSGANGNDNNTIDNCSIDGGAGATASPTLVALNGIYSAGTTTTTATNNSNNTISNNKIFNFFGAAGSTSAGISLQTGNTDWTITGNSFYQTATRTATSSATVYGITIANSGNNFIVTGNYIGGSSANAGGSAWTFNGAVANRFNGIGLSVGTTTASSVQGNTIANFAFTSTSSATANSTSTPLGTGAWGGIMIAAGSANVGNVTANTIGAATGTGSVTFNGGTTGGTINGIGVSGSGTVVISNNNIGAITTSGSGATISTGIIGIQSASTGTVTISNNIIGSTSTGSSLNASQASTSSTAQIITGINNSGTATALSITGNTLANWVNAYVPSSASSSRIIGGIVTSAGAATITGNTIRNISCAANATGTGTTSSMIGISDASSGTTESISNNTIFSLSNTNSSANSISVFGIVTTAGGGTVSKNVIYGLTNAATGTNPFAGGLFMSSTGTFTVSNNMITITNGALTNGMQCAGIYDNATGTRNYYYNSIYIGGTQTSSTCNSVAFQRASSATVTIKNNIFDMQRTGGGTGKFYGIANNNGTPATNWAASASDYNLINSSNTATVGLWGTVGTGDRTFVQWQASQGAATPGSGGDANSVTAATPPYTDLSTGNLHMVVSATATPVESGGTAIAAIIDDIDATGIRAAANYPLTGQLNGGGTAPDLGADEFDGAPKDQTAPSITYTALSSTCSVANVTLSGVTITDGSGVPTAGSLVPRIYYKKGAGGTWFSQAGSLTSGTAKNGQWSFTIVTSDMGGVASGDVIYYYVIAQDIASPANIGSTPGAGLVATDVNTVGTVPTTPNTYTILATLNGLYSVGASNIGGEAGHYGTLTAAVAAYNSACLTGPVIFALTDATYSGSETFPITVNANTNASSTNTLTIVPNTGVTSAITGSNATALIKLNGADYVTIDGSNSGGTTRNLTINNTSTTASSAGILVASLGTGAGATFDVIKNCNINTGTSSSVTYGISAGTAGGTSGADNDNLTIQNNAITVATTGIYAYGTASVSTGGMDNLNVTGNSVTNNASTSPVNGIQLGQSLNSTVSQNTISVTTSASASPVGISLETGFVSSSVSKNLITTVYTSATGGWGGRGITVGTATASSALTISNNMIYGVNGGSNFSGFGNSSSMGIGIGTIGGSTTITTTAGGVNIYYNSINMYGNHSYTSATNTAALYVGSAASALDIRNNIFVNSLNNTTTAGSKNYGIYSAAAIGAFTTINNNDYFGVSSTNSTFVPGYISSADQTTLTAMQTAFGGNTNSTLANPLFTSNTDLHLQSSSPMNAGAVVISGITTDYDGAARDASTPDIGADEFTPPADDAGITGLAVTYYCAGNNNVQVTLKNYGSATLTSATINWTVNGVAQTPYNWTGSLAGGASTTAVISPAYNFLANTNYTLIISTGLPNGNTDANATNDSYTSGTFQTGLSGTYTVGSGGNYTTLTAAVAAANAYGLCGPTIFSLTDASYSGSETFPIVINSLTGASSTNTLTIKPASGVTSTISGSSASAVIKLNGADYIRIDGSNNGTSTRNLTIANTNTGTSSTIVWLASVASPADGATNNIIKNIIATGNSSSTTFGGIISTGSVVTNIADAQNSNNTVQNNVVTAAVYGIVFSGATANDITNSVTGNTVGSAVAASKIGTAGIFVSNQQGVTVTGNTVMGINSTGNVLTAGIYAAGTMAGGTIATNKVSDIKNTTSRQSFGIELTSSSTSGNVSVYNNMVFDVSCLGGNATLSRGGHGIAIMTGGGYSIYFNTVNLNTDQGGTTANNAALYVATGVTGLDIRNNIFVNSQPSAANRFAIYSDAANTAYTTIDFNDYTSSGAALGYIGSARTALSDIVAGFGQNTGSVSIAPAFTSATDMHLPPSSNISLNDLGTPALSITTDIDGDTRPAAGSTNPDMGADEFKPSTDDAGITGLVSSAFCPGSQSVSVVLKNFATTPLTSVNIDWTVNGVAQTQYNWTGSLATNATTNVTLTPPYTFLAATNYVITATTSLPNGNTDAATSNDTYTSPTFQTSLSGTYTVGSGGNFTTLTAAVAAANTSGICGPTVFSLTDAAYNAGSGETFPITINQLTGSSSVNTLTIVPATGVNATVSGSNATAIIKLNGADYIIIDGSNSGGTTRNLTISNTNTGTSSAGVLIASLGAGAGATNDVLKNCNISTGSSSNTTYGISAGTTAGAGGADNDNLTLQNNAVTVATVGIYANGTAAVSAGGLDNLVVSGNSVTSNGSSTTAYGIQLGNALNSTVSQNTVNISTSASTAPVAISLETGFVSSVISRNLISAAITSATGGYAGRGITIGTNSASSNLTVSNNIIYGVNGSNWSGFGASSSMGIAVGIVGNSSTLTTTTGGVNLYYNSVSLSGSMGSGSSSAITTAIYIGSGASALDIRNNIFSNTQTATSTTQKNFAIYSAAANTAFSTINYNDYYVANSFNTASAILGNIGGTDRTTLANIVTGFGGNANSLAVDPVFTSSTNLHLQTTSTLDAKATPIGGITNDYDGDTRDASTPDIGADEFIVPLCSGAAGGTAAGSVSLCNSGSATVTASGYSTGTGIQYQWQYSNDNFSSDIHDLTGQTTPGSASTGTITSTTYYRLKVVCPAASATGYSTTVTITVNAPAVLSTTPASRCGIGTVTLGATGTGAGTLNWYSALTGGALLGSGTSFTTPSISGTTTYYVAEEITNAVAGSTAVGTSTTTDLGSSIYRGGYGNGDFRHQLLYTAAELTAAGLTSGNITAFSVNVTSAGAGSYNNYMIKMSNVSNTTNSSTFITPSSSTTVFNAATYTPATSGTNTHTFTTPFYWDGTSSVLIDICYNITATNSSTTLSMNSPTNKTASAFGVTVGTGCTYATATLQTYRPVLTFSGQIGSTCSSSPRTSVTATVSTPPSLTISTGSTTNCAGSPSATVTLTSPVGNYNTYSWSPATGVTGNENTGWTFAPSATTTYTLTASQTGGSLCANTVTLTVTSNSAPAAPVVSPVTANVCSPVSQVITAVSNGALTTILSENFNTMSSAGTTTTYPAGWTATNTSTGGTVTDARWRDRNNGYNYLDSFFGDTYYTFNSNDNTQFVLSNSDDQAGTTTQTTLVSPAFSTVNYNTATLSFYHNYSHITGDSATVEISLNGTTWTYLKSYKTDQGTETYLGDDGFYYYYQENFAADNITIPSGFLNKSTVYIRFRYESTYGFWWALDNFKVEGNPQASIAWTANPSIGAGLPAGAGTASTANASITVTPTATGTIIYTATATGSNGCPAASTASVTLNVSDNTWAGIDNNWFNAANWCGGVPTANTNVSIPVVGSGLYPIITTGTALANNISIASGAASVTVNGTGIFSLGGTVTNAGGTFDLTAGTLNLAGSGSASIAGSAILNGTVKNLTISANSSITTGSTNMLNVTGDVSFLTSNNTFTTNGNLTLVSGATTTASVTDITANGTLSGNSISGDAVVQRYIPAGRKWRLLAVNPYAASQTVQSSWMNGQTPGTAGPAGKGMWVTDPSGTGFDAVSNGATIKWWDINTGAYIGITNPTTYNIRSHDAYMTFVRGDRTQTGSNSTTASTVLSTTGSLAQNTTTIITVPSGSNYITVGNPYASAVDLTKLLYSTTSTINIAIWDPNLGSSLGAFQYLSKTSAASNFTITPGGGSYGSFGSVMNAIESGQGFFIQGSSSSRDVQFREIAKTPKAHDVFFTAGNEQKIKGTLAVVENGGANVIDGLQMISKAGYNNNADPDDAHKMANTSEAVSIRKGNTLLALEYRNVVDETDTVFLNMASMRQKDYRWNFDLENMDQPGRIGFLVDKYTGTQTPLNLAGANSYNFTVSSNTASSAADRFMIIFKQAIALPVTLTSISANRLNNGNVEVRWKAENEINIAHYEVERSANGTTFTTIINNVLPTNNAGGSAEYVKTDVRPLSGDSYYRVRAVSANGQVQFTAIVKVAALMKEPAITVYPNPMTDRVMNIRFTNKAAGSYQLQLIDRAGRTVYTGEATVSSLNETKTISLPGNLPAGAYSLLIRSESGEAERKELLMK